MSALTLFEVHGTRSHRVRWTLLELGIPFESVAGGDVIGSARLRAVTPSAKVPAILDEGRPLFESAAICTWLADRHAPGKLIAASGSWERALHDQWVAFCLAELEAHLWSTARNTFVYPPERRETAMLGQNELEGRKSLAILEAQLGKAPFLVGGRFSVTDIIVGFAVHWARGVGWAADSSRCLAYDDLLIAMPHCPYAQPAPAQAARAPRS